VKSIIWWLRGLLFYEEKWVAVVGVAGSRKSWARPKLIRFKWDAPVMKYGLLHLVGPYDNYEKAKAACAEWNKEEEAPERETVCTGCAWSDTAKCPSKQ